MKRFFEKLKKKKMNPGGVILVEEDLYPKVIKETKLKPTTCAGCLTVYQAKAKHMNMAFETGVRTTTCPICGTYNRVEYETDDEDDEWSDK